MQATAEKWISAEDYLTAEVATPEKKEYFEGQVIPMSGASLTHNRIVSNLIFYIRALIGTKDCEILPSDIRVSAPFYQSYMYPDATIVCGKPQMEDNHFDTLTNPTVIFEVLSPGTEDHDRGKKFFYYRQIASLKEYILIDTLQPFIEISCRQDDNSWIFSEITSIEKALEIRSISKSVKLSDIYKNVEFPVK